jgi:hypothetical protein
MMLQISIPTLLGENNMIWNWDPRVWSLLLLSDCKWQSRRGEWPHVPSRSAIFLDPPPLIATRHIIGSWATGEQGQQTFMQGEGVKIQGHFSIS